MGDGGGLNKASVFYRLVSKHAFVGRYGPTGYALEVEKRYIRRFLRHHIIINVGVRRIVDLGHHARYRLFDMDYMLDEGVVVGSDETSLMNMFVRISERICNSHSRRYYYDHSSAMNCPVIAFGRPIHAIYAARLSYIVGQLDMIRRFMENEATEFERLGYSE